MTGAAASSLACLAVALAWTASAVAAGAEPMHEKGATATYAPFPPINAMVVHADGTRGVLSVQGGLDAKDPKLRARATASLPRLRDAWSRTLSVYALALRPGAPPDADQIADRLQRATDQTLQRPGARVLIGTVMVN
jgi:hypothetical protein